MNDFRILNGTVVSGGAARRLDVALDGGRIVELASPGGLGPARREYDANDLLVLPGAVDVHFHCRAPSHPERGDFESETRAAAAGGVTTVLEMPISSPACSTPEVLEMRRRLAERDAWVNVGLFAGGAVRSEAEAAALLEAGAIGFKLFTTRPPVGREDEFSGISAPSDELVYRALESIAAAGATVTVHAEHQGLLDMASGANHASGLRPPVIESASIALVAAMAREVGARVHIAHVTSRDAVDVIRGVQLSYDRLTAETSPHYLLLDQTAISKWGGYAKVAPPLRQADDNQALWQALRDRVVSVVASDHAPFRPAEKERTDWTTVPSGIPGVELMLPIMLDAAHRGVVSLTDVPDITSESPARLFGMYPAKGTVAVGSDADLVIHDPRPLTVVDHRSLHSRAAPSAPMFDGLAIRGRIAASIIGGQVVFSDGELIQRGGRIVMGQGSLTRKLGV